MKISFDEHIRFVAHLKPLKINDVKAEVTNTLESVLSVVYPLSSPSFCFMRFSDEDLIIARGELGVDVTQVTTKHSILLKSESTFRKLIPQLVEKDSLSLLNRRLNNPKHITLCTTIRDIGYQQFFKFPAQLPPLNKDKVRQCLYDFMTRTATALEELHRFGYAHLDVRIPNICFAKANERRSKYIVDLDRCAFSEPYIDLRWRVHLFCTIL